MTKQRILTALGGTSGMQDMIAVLMQSPSGTMFSVVASQDADSGDPVLLISTPVIEDRRWCFDLAEASAIAESMRLVAEQNPSNPAAETCKDMAALITASVGDVMVRH